MQKFSGLEIKPYSQLTELPRVRIDRVRVEVQRTLFGEVEYHLVGTYGDEGRAYPICQPFAELPDVWEKKKEIESAIFKARQEEQYAKKKKRRGLSGDTRRAGLSCGKPSITACLRVVHIIHASVYLRRRTMRAGCAARCRQAFLCRNCVRRRKACRVRSATRT